MNRIKAQITKAVAEGHDEVDTSVSLKAVDNIQEGEKVEEGGDGDGVEPEILDTPEAKEFDSSERGLDEGTHEEDRTPKDKQSDDDDADKKGDQINNLENKLTKSCIVTML